VIEDVSSGQEINPHQQSQKEAELAKDLNQLAEMSAHRALLIANPLPM
jgi:hypothetical protein